MRDVADAVVEDGMESDAKGHKCDGKRSEQ
jgi:hypothetical protein